MEWDNIKEKYKHFYKDWEHYPKEYCDPTIIPDQEELFKEYQLSKSTSENNEEWIESIHPFCLSCYSNYKEVCHQVGTYFHMSSKWDKDLLPEFVNEFIKKQSNETDMEKKIIAYENGLILFGECINTRWFHHDQCFKETKNKNNKNVEVSNEGHMYFLLVIALQFKKIYLLYTNSISTYNIEQDAFNRKKRHKNVILETHSTIINICRNVIKNYGNQDDIVNIDKILATKDTIIKRRKSKSLVKIQNNQEIKMHIK